MQRRRKPPPVLHSRLQKIPNAELAPARQLYFLAVLYLAVLPSCSQWSLDSTALSNSSMTAFLQSPSVILVLCSGVWRAAGAFFSASGMYEEVTWGFGHELEMGDGSGLKLQSWFCFTRILKTCEFLWNSATHNSINPTLPKTSDFKRFLLLMSRKTTSSGLGSQLELEICRIPTQIPL